MSLSGEVVPLMRIQISCCHFVEAAILAMQARGSSESIFTSFPGPLMTGKHELK